ncbi:YtxH domain-containing protein [Niveispirillum irakense]|uniref:YtxH domain-containing protein n=1 Tax=Niveispirillum irakense TaxID=34011 RepID=UPI000423193D|nr:YtxH domain-containing protein [Niveispirillum irakense]
MTYSNDYGTTKGPGAAGTAPQPDSDTLDYRDPLSQSRFPEDEGYAVTNGHARNGNGSSIGGLIHDNRVPLALIGAGLGWLLLSAARKTEAYDRAAHWADDHTRSARNRLSRKYDELSHRVEEGLHKATHRLDEAAHDISDKASELRAEARRRLKRMRPSRQVQELSDRYAGYGDSAYGYHYEDDSEGHRRYRRIVAESEAIAHRARRRAARINRSFWDMVDEHPISAGLVGLAVGAAVGAALPATRTEDEWMGKYRDGLLDEALAKGRRTAEKAANVAKEAAKAGTDAALKTAEEEADRQGLKSEVM